MSNFPNSVDGPSTLYSPVDAFSTLPLVTTLAVLALPGDVTLQLSVTPSSIGLATSYGVVTIDDEEIIYTGTSGHNLTGCIRGAFGTTAIGHAQGAQVNALMVSGYLIALQTAVVAIENVIGVSGSFNFAPVSTAGVWAQVGSNIYNTNSGFVGIGTSTPTSVLHVVDTGGSTVYSIAADQVSTDPKASQLWLRKARGTPSALAAVANADVLGNHAYAGYDGTQYTNSFQVEVVVNGTVATSNVPGDLVFQSVNSGTTNERVRIQSGGKVGIGTAIPDQLLTVAGVVHSTSGGFEFPDGTVQTTAAAGAGGGANTALSNLSAVAINTTLLPGAAGTISLGSAALPFQYLYLAGTSGSPASNNFQFTGTATAARLVVFPDVNSITWGYDGTNVWNPNSGFVGIGTNAPGFELDVVGFFRTGVNTTTIPASSYGMVVGWNRSGGQGEVNIYNVFNSAPHGFVFSQKTGTSTYVDILTISNGTPMMTVPGQIYSSSVGFKFPDGSTLATGAAFVGDTGSGGTAGIVPAPAAGDAAAGKFLYAGGGWSPSLFPLAQFYASIGNFSNTLTTAYSYTLPANQLANNGDRLMLRFAVVVSIPSGPQQQVQLTIGGTTIVNRTLQVIPGGGLNWLDFSMTLLRLSSSAFIATYLWTEAQTATGYVLPVNAVGALNMTVANNIILAIQSSGTNFATNQIFAQLMTIDYVRAV